MELSSKMEFFQKLGYDREDVVRVLEKLGQGALVNDVLQELIQTGSRPGARQGGPAPLLVPRGSCSAADSTQRALGADPKEDCEDPTSSLRPIVIDGSNVAMSHGNKEAFSCRGIQLAVDWFRERGHTYIKVFVPSWRKDPPRADTPIREQHVLEELERQAVLVCTPSRKVNGKRVVCYDDRYIVKVAYEQDGIIVSNDNYRDLQSENPEWKWFIEQRLLMFSFVNDRFMPPDDPLGRRGPTLSTFLSMKPKPPEPSWQHCPYGRKCTYGIKCKFYHPERPHHAQLAVADELRAQTWTWRRAGTGEARPRGQGEQSPPRVVPAATSTGLGPRDSQARSLPPTRQAAGVAGLEEGLSRLAFSDNLGSLAVTPPGHGCGRGLAPGSRCPDWVAPAAPLSLPVLSGPSNTQSRSRRLVQTADCPGDPRGDLLPQRRPPLDPWALSQEAARFPAREAWAELGWGDGASRGPWGPAAREPEERARARTALCSVFPPRQVARAMALCPALSDVARLTVLIQRLQRSGATGGTP